MKKHIPNFITLLNLSSGVLGIYMVLNGNPEAALLFFLASIVFDFMDGIAARLLKVGSELGKQLDSLADIISFGLFSTAMVFVIMKLLIMKDHEVSISEFSLLEKILLSTVLIIPVFSAIRLAKFNLQENTSVFLGLPVPAFALFWAGIYYDLCTENSFFGQSLNLWFILGIMLMTTILMIIPLPMLSMKFTNFSFRSNFGRYVLILVSAIILIFTGIAGLPLVILTYILLSLLKILLT